MMSGGGGGGRGGLRGPAQSCATEKRGFSTFALLSKEERAGGIERGMSVYLAVNAPGLGAYVSGRIRGQRSSTAAALGRNAVLRALVGTVSQSKTTSACGGFRLMRTASESDAFKIYEVGDDGASKGYQHRFRGAHHTSSENISRE